MHTVTNKIATTTIRIRNHLLNDQSCCWKSLQPKNRSILYIVFLFVHFSLNLHLMNVLFHEYNSYCIIILIAFAYDDTYLHIYWNMADSLCDSDNTKGVLISKWEGIQCCWCITRWLIIMINYNEAISLNFVYMK